MAQWSGEVVQGYFTGDCVEVAQWSGEVVQRYLMGDSGRWHSGVVR